MKYKRSDGFCWVCTRVNTTSDSHFSAFDCNGKHFGLCGTIYILICHATINLFIIIDIFDIMIIQTDSSGVSLI